MENKILCLRRGSNPRPTAFEANVLQLDHKGQTNGRERTTPRLILKYIENISLQRHPLETIWHMEETPEIIWKSECLTRRRLWVRTPPRAQNFVFHILI